jgi:hypothetical protein
VNELWTLLALESWRRVVANGTPAVAAFETGAPLEMAG